MGETGNADLELTDDLKDFIDFQEILKKQFPGPKPPKKIIDENEEQMFENDLGYRQEVIEALHQQAGRELYDVDDDMVELDQDDIPEPEGVEVEEEAQEADGDQPIALFVPMLLLGGADPPFGV